VLDLPSLSLHLRLLSPLHLPIPSPTTLGPNIPRVLFPCQRPLGGTSQLDHGRAAAKHIIFGKYIGPRFCVRFFMKGAHSMCLFHIHTTHSTNTRAHPTPTLLGKVYKRVLVVPPSSPHQRAFICGACIGTAQVGVSLVSLFDLLFERSRLYCLDVF